jgi:DNA-binding transcriptional LysR family regulator
MLIYERILREKPAGTVRITAHEHSASTILWPKLSKLLPEYPDLSIEINLNPGFVNIVAERYDAGVRLGDQVGRDMIAVRIAPDHRMAVVGAPSYFATWSKPRTPDDLTKHNCINLRLSTHGCLYAWEFARNEKKLQVHVQGQLTFNTMQQKLEAALGGYGLVYVPEGIVRRYEEEGRLVRVLDDWCPAFPGYHIHYPSRRQPSPAFILVVNALRYEA